MSPAAAPEPPRVSLVGGPGGGRRKLGRPDRVDVVGSDHGHRRWPAVAVAVLLLGGFGAVRADAALVQRELDALLDRAEAGLSTVAYTDRRLQGTSSTLSRAGVAVGGAARPRQPAGHRARGGGGAGRGAPRHRDAAAAVRVLPWHDAERAARDRWVAYLDARIAFLEAVSEQFRRLYQPRPEQEAALAQAREAFTRAGAAGARTAAVFDR